MTRWMIGPLLAGAVQVGAVDFYAHWADGKAELSSYEVVQPRYGELRLGYGVMIFVTEDLHRQTLLKVESPAPEADQFYALKLNHILKFATGIYDYSVMTSVFSQVAGERHPFELRRISFSAQEWCGQVFDEALFSGGQINGHISSYFASEGRGAYQLKQPAHFASEDHLLIRIRELQGPFMALGEVQKLEVLPSFWQLRQAHQPHATVRGANPQGRRGADSDGRRCAGQRQVGAAHWPAAADVVDGKSLSASNSALGGRGWGARRIGADDPGSLLAVAGQRRRGVPAGVGHSLRFSQKAAPTANR